MRTRRSPSSRARKAPAAIPALLPKVRAGRLSADAFYRATAQDFIRLAAALVRNWDLPSSVDLDDVAQELRRHVLAGVEKWDPARGVDLADFAQYRAHDRTKRWLHRQREAKPSKAVHKQASRYPLLLIDAVEREEREAMMARLGGEPTPEEIAAAQERVELVRKLAAVMGMTVEELSRGVGRASVREEARAVLTERLLASNWEECTPRERGRKIAEEWLS